MTGGEREAVPNGELSKTSALSSGEGIIIIVSVQWHRITGDSIGGGIFVVVKQSACVQTLYLIGNVMYDIVHDNVHDICIQTSIS